MPTEIFGNQTPYFRLFNEQPLLGNLKTFRCLCFVTTTKPKGKFAPREARGVFLGYSFSKKGYNLLCIETSLCLVSQDVSFSEDIFPFLTKEDDCSTLHDFFLFPPLQPTTTSVEDQPDRPHDPSAPMHDTLHFTSSNDDDDDNTGDTIEPSIADDA